MTPLMRALRAKFKTPQDAVAALGLDTGLLSKVVGDSKNQEIRMTNRVLSAKAAVAAGALTIYLKPLLAADAKIDLGPVLKGVTDANFAGRKAAISAKLGEITKGKLAADAKLDGLPKVMDSIEEIDAKDEEPESEEESEEEKKAKEGKDKKHAKDKRAKDAAEKEGEKRKVLENTLSEDDMASWDAMCAAAKDAEIEEPDESKEDEEEEKPAVDKGKKAKDKRAKDAEPEGEEKVTKKAMDAAITAATAKATADAIATQREIGAAVEEVTPLVGKLTMSFDSAEAVYKQALKMRAVDVKGIHPSAYRAIFKNLPSPTKRREGGSLAMDAGSLDSFNEMFPTAAPVVAA